MGEAETAGSERAYLRIDATSMIKGMSSEKPSLVFLRWMEAI